MKQALRRFLRADEGMSLIEYALIVALISLAALAGTQVLGSKVNSNFNSIGNALN